MVLSIKYKARLVIKGFVQIFGVDYLHTFAPVTWFDTMLLAIAAQKGWKMFHLDVKSALLNGVLHEEIYIEQPEGWLSKEKKKKYVCLEKLFMD